ncbi:PHP domain-containing protein [Balneolaceae bacterium ANBcel3]|nr:PHP domain-containing protein [Balneolaceae bacterium ANBcel3]
MYKADLHIHTQASDGKLSPPQVVDEALSRGIDVIAITDHDTITGVSIARKHAKGTGLQVIQGVEISTLFNGRECHLLAYAFEDDEVISKLLGDQKKRRIMRAREIIKNLNKMGFDITWDDVIGEAGLSSVGRPHIARVLIKKGYAADIQEAFFRYLGNQSSAYHKIDYPLTEEAISYVHQAGGFAVLAHPGNHYTYIDLKNMMDAGLDGIECYHPSHNSSHQKKYLEYCENYGLMITGGSDFHGKPSDYYHLGVIHCKIDPEHPFLQKQGAEVISNA